MTLYMAEVHLGCQIAKTGWPRFFQVPLTGRQNLYVRFFSEKSKVQVLANHPDDNLNGLGGFF